MSKEQRYYLENREAILEKRRSKAAADKLKKKDEILNEYELLKSKFPTINKIGDNIYETIIDEGYRNDSDSVTKLLSTKMDEKYELGGMTHLEILADYLALSNIVFDIRNYPWKIIKENLNLNFSYYVKNKRLYYNNFRNKKKIISKNPTLDTNGDITLYTYICKLIWDHNEVSDEKWNSGFINPHSSVVELNDILNLVYSNTYSTYKK